MPQWNLSDKVDCISHNFNFTCNKLILNATKWTIFFTAVTLYVTVLHLCTKQCDYLELFSHSITFFMLYSEVKWVSIHVIELLT